MPGWLSGLLATLLPALFDALFQGFASARQDAAHDQANQDLGAQRAGNETLDTIGAIAAARADLPPSPSDAGDLAHRLRERAERDRAAERGSSAAIRPSDARAG